MTIKNEKNLKLQLFDAVKPKLETQGFKLNAAKNLFVRKIEKNISDRFMLVSPYSYSAWQVRPSVAIRIEILEDIYHQVSGYEKKNQQGTPSIGNSIGSMMFGDVQKCQFAMSSIADVMHTAEKLESVFNDIALPYYQKYGSIKAIDELLNSQPNEQSRHRLPWERCATGIIAAKLVGRNDYDNLVNIYTEKLKVIQNGFYSDKFRKLVKVLESIDPLQ